MKAETKHDPAEQVVGCSLLLASMPFSMTWGILRGGFTLMMLWRWFVVPTFNGPELSLPVAGGLMVLAWFATAKWPDKDTDDGALVVFKKAVVREITLTIYTALVLLEGYVIHRVWLS